ncbi:helicase [Aphelenchoides avenae]|nr:helicase [Aphelenchus avenae]
MPGAVVPSETEPAPIIEIAGEGHPVKIYYDPAKVPADGVLDAALHKASSEIIDKCRPGDILIFLAGQEEINRACTLLREHYRGTGVLLTICPLYSASPAHEQRAALKPAPEGHRKVVIATNIAETSLTIEGIVYVIDGGMANRLQYFPYSGFYRMRNERISQSAANQRKGRAGRVANGHCYRLYTEAEFNEMRPYETPDILQSELSEVVLQMRVLGINNLTSFDFMDKPNPEVYKKAIADLQAIGALENNPEAKPMPYGIKLLKLALEPRLAHLLLMSVHYRCTAEMLVIVAALSADTNKFFWYPGLTEQNQDKYAEAVRSIASFKRREGEHLTFLNVYRQWIASGTSSERRRQWCDEFYVQHSTMEAIKKHVDQLREQMELLRIPVISCGAEYSRIQQALPVAFSSNLAYRSDYGQYTWVAKPEYTLSIGDESVFSESCVIAVRRAAPNIVVCHRVVIRSGHNVMQVVTEVKREMLPDDDDDPIRRRIPEMPDNALDDPLLESTLLQPDISNGGY